VPGFLEGRVHECSAESVSASGGVT
jgi:hypothetical protein